MQPLATLLVLAIALALELAPAGASLLAQFGFVASQNHYTTQNQFQAPFSLETVRGPALELAAQSCRESFRWQRWNCPGSDFLRRRAAEPRLQDREDAFVAALGTAAELYTIAKNCSSGLVAGCGCPENALATHCADDPARAEELYERHLAGASAHPADPEDFAGSARRHNHRAVTNLLRRSLVQQCGCRLLGPAGCLETVCWDVLRPFDEIARELRQMYEAGLQLSDAGANAQVIWRNIPLDSLVFVKDSPNFCEPDAVPGWNGMRGRRCAVAAGAAEERDSCFRLCRACGYQVRARQVVTERRCNCKFAWGFRVQCDACVHVEHQHYCY